MQHTPFNSKNKSIVVSFISQSSLNNPKHSVLSSSSMSSSSSSSSSSSLRTSKSSSSSSRTVICFFLFLFFFLNAFNFAALTIIISLNEIIEGWGIDFGTLLSDVWLAKGGWGLPQRQFCLPVSRPDLRAALQQGLRGRPRTEFYLCTTYCSFLFLCPKLCFIFLFLFLFSFFPFNYWVVLFLYVPKMMVASDPKDDRQQWKQ